MSAVLSDCFTKQEARTSQVSLVCNQSNLHELSKRLDHIVDHLINQYIYYARRSNLALEPGAISSGKGQILL